MEKSDDQKAAEASATASQSPLPSEQVAANLRETFASAAGHYMQRWDDAEQRERERLTRLKRKPGTIER